MHRITLAWTALLAAAPLWGAAEARLSTRFLTLTAAPDGALRVTDRRNHRQWTQQAPGATVQSVKRDGARLVIHGPGGLHASVTLVKDRPEVEVVLEGSGPLRDPVAFPFPFVTAPGTWLVVPMNEGILYPVDDATIQPFSLVGYGGHGISMPWFGAADLATGAGVMAIVGTPDDMRIEIVRRGTLAIRPLWEASRGEFRYPRRIRYVFFDRGGYVAQAKRYREHAAGAGLFRTLADKRRDVPAVDLLMGAVNVWYRGNDRTAMARDLKAAGIDRVLWSAGGSPGDIREINALGFLTGRYDIFQDVWPPEAPSSLRREGWPDDLVWLPNGQWMKGWAHHERRPDGTVKIWEGGVISSPRQLERARRQIPAELQTIPYAARFIDTTTASPWREDYNPAHPLTRSEDRRYKMALLEYVSKDLKLVTGTETGIDPSVPFVHYFEGMLSLGRYRLPDAGRDTLAYKAPTPDFLKFQVGHYYRVPLWELVYHECVVSQWYWGDYNNKTPKVWDRRDLFNLLYATPPMFMYNRETWGKSRERFVASYRATGPVARRLGYDEMLSHEFVTADHAVQRTRWKSGAEIVVNFGAGPYRLPGGRTVPAMGSLVE